MRNDSPLEVAQDRSRDSRDPDPEIRIRIQKTDLTSVDLSFPVVRVGA